jgi:hypothetical protein
MPKTATTTLQWRIFAGHSEIYYLGRYDGRLFQGEYRPFNFCRNQTVQEVMEQIAYKDIFTPNISKCRELLTLALQPALENNLVPVWSWESYATDVFAKRQVRAENLKELFGAAKIIMTLRHPVALLESTYFLVTRRNNIGAKGYRGRLPSYAPIDKWLEKHLHGEVMPHLEYAQTIKTYMDLFGKENVHVLLFEDLVADQTGFVREICHIMGIDADESLALVGENNDNSRWTTLQIDTLKKIQRSLFATLKFTLSNKAVRRKMLNLDESGVPVAAAPKARASIPPEWQKRIHEITAEGNQWLTEEFGLPLEKYGYFG